MAVQSQEHLRRQPSRGQVCYSIIWSNRRRGADTWSQDSVTSLPSAKQRPGIHVLLNYWSNRRRVMESGTSPLSAKLRPGM